MRQHITTQRCDESQTLGMIEAYLQGLSAKKAAQKFGFKDHKTCHAALRRMGIPLEERTGRNRKYQFDEHFFESIDNEYKAYWLGFIAADGSINKYVLSFHLGIIDKDHLKKFIDDISGTQKVTELTRKNKGQFAVTNVSSKIMITSLEKYSIIPHKSKTLKPWNGESSLMRYYWRGVFDGDGSLCKTQTGEWCMNCVGNQEMMNAFLRYAQEVCGTQTHVNPHGPSWSFVINGRYMIEKLMHHLYEDSQVFLTRKYELAQQLFAENLCLN